jgi:hypothetical protein
MGSRCAQSRKLCTLARICSINGSEQPRPINRPPNLGLSNVDRLRQVIVSDTTRLPLQNGERAYLATRMGLFSRRIVGRPVSVCIIYCIVNAWPRPPEFAGKPSIMPPFAVRRSAFTIPRGAGTIQQKKFIAVPKPSRTAES